MNLPYVKIDLLWGLALKMSQLYMLNESGLTHSYTKANLLIMIIRLRHIRRQRMMGNVNDMPMFPLLKKR